jgi:hypothetical protein
MVLFDVASGTITLDKGPRTSVDEINSTECSKSGGKNWPCSFSVRADVGDTDRGKYGATAADLYSFSRCL